MNKLSHHIKNLRNKKNFTQRYLGEILGVSQVAIYKWEKGLSEPDSETLKKLSELFNVSIEYLLGTTNNPTPIQDLIPKNAIEIVNFIKIPVIGSISCGNPLTAIENIIEYRDVDPTRLPKGANSFFLKANGDSMKDIGIKDGAYVLIREQCEVENGEIAAVIVNSDNEATLKRFFKQGDVVILKAENRDFKDLVFEKKDQYDFRIIGKAIRFECDL